MSQSLYFSLRRLNCNGISSKFYQSLVAVQVRNHSQEIDIKVICTKITRPALISAHLKQCRRHLCTQRPPWRTMFFGTDEYALDYLRVLNKNRNQNERKIVGHLEVVVPTKKCAVKDYAKSAGLQIHDWSPKDLKQTITNGGFDVGVLVSFGHLIPASIIDSFPYGILNGHPSLLPRWRGAGPLLHTILNGDKETGISIMEIRPINFDLGPLLSQKKFPVPDNCTSVQLRDYMGAEGSKLMLSTLRDLINLRQISRRQSNEGATLAPKLEKVNALVNWKGNTMIQIDRQYRTLSEIVNRFHPVGKTLNCYLRQEEHPALKNLPHSQHVYNHLRTCLAKLAYPCLRGINVDKTLECVLKYGLKTVWNGKKIRLFDKVPFVDMLEVDAESLLSDHRLVTPPGTVVYCQKREILCVKCRDGWVGFKGIVLKKKMSAKSFFCGYLSKPQYQNIILESHENFLFKDQTNEINKENEIIRTQKVILR